MTKSICDTERSSEECMVLAMALWEKGVPYATPEELVQEAIELEKSIESHARGCVMDAIHHGYIDPGDGGDSSEAEDLYDAMVFLMELVQEEPATTS